MVKFTTLINRGHKRYIAKYIKKRVFGKCNGCDKPTLLLEYIDPKDSSNVWQICEDCFTKLQNDENE